jgi:hypothetical protein
MSDRLSVFAAGLTFIVAAAYAHAALLTPVWVELGEGGNAFARVVVDQAGGCPTIEIDGAPRRMSLRAPVPDAFRPVCELAIPAGAQSARVNGQMLALPRSNPSKVLVFGDTGCRIKGAHIQDCNDPVLWPFKKVAGEAAAEHPDLVIHVGDYLYREEVCPPDAQAKCGSTPSGDRWETWNADFFAPAAELLRAAPWAFDRGNHEDCNRAWRGWFYYLDPRPWKGEACEAYTAPYVLHLGNLTLAMFDSSATNEDHMSAEQTDKFASQLASIHVRGAWLVAHHPFWGMRTSPAGARPAPVSAGLMEAWKKASPQGIDLILSGHIHLFEVLSFERLPVQVVAGIGGTDLAVPLPDQLDGLSLNSSMVLAGESKHEFGYTLFTRTSQGWELSLRNAAGDPQVACGIRGRKAECRRVQATSAGSVR